MYIKHRRILKSLFYQSILMKLLLHRFVRRVSFLYLIHSNVLFSLSSFVLRHKLCNGGTSHNWERMKLYPETEQAEAHDLFPNFSSCFQLCNVFIAIVSRKILQDPDCATRCVSLLKSLPVIKPQALHLP